MKTIRVGTFETNSSSSHSISIHDSDDLLTSITPDADGRLRLAGGDFGWQWEVYTDALTKASYCAIFCVRLNLNAETNMLIHVLKSHTGATEIDLGVEPGWSLDSHIDHESLQRRRLDAVFRDPASLRQFIFHPRSKLFTGNDNETPPPNFYDADDKTYDFLFEMDGSPSIKVTKEEIADRGKLEGVVLDSYRRRESGSGSWSVDHAARRPEDDTLLAIDFDEQTLRIDHEKPQYDEKGEFTGYKHIESKKLPWILTPLPTSNPNKYSTNTGMAITT